MLSLLTKENLKRFNDRINGSKIEHNLKSYFQIVKKIRSVELTYQSLNSHDLKKKARWLAVQAASGLCLDNLMIDVFALVCVATHRTLGISPFDEQLIGGILLHQGKIAEMSTGEGKTITATFPACLNALTGKGVHILTFNDYLASRDADWMKPVYEFIGLSTGVIQAAMPIAGRKHAYQADITYVTAREAGFDFLRDSLIDDLSNCVHRSLNVGIIDEADSILIDESRIPLIIAGSVHEDHINPNLAAVVVRDLVKGVDVDFDETARNVFLTETGMQKVEQKLDIKNLYANENLELLSQIQSAIHAQFLLTKDIDYIVRDHKIELIDEFTGRVAISRRWPDNIQAALEAKEGVSIQKKGRIMHSITIQSFIRQYQKIAGMTATAQSAESEFWDVYGLSIGVIPTHHPCKRIDHIDIVFDTKADKQNAIINEIIHTHNSGRPILVGTSSVEESNELASRLAANGITCQVLNAREDVYEAQIIATAGKIGSVIISTNMAGRGVDIHLGGKDRKEKEIVISLGGLYVIGTNKNESQRIDQQLRGRAGRQGDPGSSRYFVSLEDNLFVKHKISSFLRISTFDRDETGAISNPLIHIELTKFQAEIERQHLEIKKTLLKYSQIIDAQRKVIQEVRDTFLYPDQAKAFFIQSIPKEYKEISNRVNSYQFERLCIMILLGTLDHLWSDYLADINEVREGIHLRSYASGAISGQYPLTEFQKIAIKLFDDLDRKIEVESIRIFKSIIPSENMMEIVKRETQKPSSTWTYQVNDDPYDYSSSLFKGIGVGLAIGVYLPLIGILYFLARIGKEIKGKALRLIMKS